MFQRLHDRSRLAITLVIMSPLIVVAVITIAIGYPLHRIKTGIAGALKNMGRVRVGE